MAKGDSAITRSRRTILKLGVAKSCAAEPAFSLERALEQIGHGPYAADGVQFVEGMGWTMQAAQEDRAYFFESNSSASKVLLPGAGATCATLVERVDRSRRQSSYGPMTGAYPSEFPTSGGAPGIQMSVPAGTTSASTLSADAAAFPAPDHPSNKVPLDRILVSTDPHEPDQPLYLRFEVSAGFSGADLLRLYFSGPAGSRPDWLGLGQYCAVLLWPHAILLWERGRAPGETSDSWQKVWMGRTPAALAGLSSQVVMSVRCDVRKHPNGYRGHRILFQFGSGDDSASGGLARPETGSNTLSYRLRNTADNRPTSVEKIRLDCRRDMRLWVQLSRPVLPSSATLDDQPLHLPFLCGAGSVLGHEWYGHIPTGCDLDAALYDADTGGALTPLSARTTLGSFGFWRTYSIGPNVRRVFARYTFTSSGEKAPVLRSSRFFKDAVNRLDAGGELEFDVRRYELDLGADDAHARIEFHDLRGEATPLLERGLVPFRLETETSGDSAVLMSGYVTAQASPRGGTGPHGQAMGDSRWREWTLWAQPESIRLSAPMTNYNLNVGFDPDASATAGEPVAFKVTSVLRKLLRDSGYGLDEIDVPDLALRFWNVRSEDLRLDWTRDTLALAQQLAGDYLGMRLIHDPNAGATGRGMWRLRSYPKPPYRPHAAFYKGLSGSRKVVTDERAWIGKTPNGADGQPVVSTWIQRDTLTEEIVPPSANHVLVYAPAAAGARAGEPPDGYIVAECYNFVSAQFWSGQPIAADPSHVDYLGSARPQIHIDPHLATAEAAAWVARRIYQRVAHGYRRLVFRAPLVLVTDTADSLQSTPRPLRYGDAVLVEGGTYLVRSIRVEVDADRGGDMAQMAHYELRTPPPTEDEVTE